VVANDIPGAHDELTRLGVDPSDVLPIAGAWLRLR
jgi:hypothetical protein